MNNDRGQSLQIPNSASFTEGHIYVASLNSVKEIAFSGDIKHQFTYAVELGQQTLYVNRNITVQATNKQLSINDWLKHHSNYSANHKTYEPYIDRKHLILIGQYSDNYYVQDIAPLNETGGLL
ncbi:hypothetical protein J3T65_09815 [Staphylococcus simiae]|uniref:hypothetical protein n=1 Tax=Staphylococcus simiae TaxID=308354 RepID=UPI001A981861|nr:hypothetical protein [Staphylococcus simiae]MBO1198280.1 hypothetical protein [Staphylococcus simiae]MBO1201985.1 hypothetical protein [Staphylococcus simiae]MBO1204183.1 hypothetical protein [Staphylococcus simiae]MBO1210272.1 hypothetical protein [Staphylococcus simiae]MBO1230417.1 hypothetical protein [Staphylococcus simiae]